MCGISGIISKDKINLGQRLADMNNLAKHRGPDDEGYVLIDSTNKNFICAAGNDTPQDSWNTLTGYQPSIDIQNSNQLVNLGLGHRRLSILDLSPFGHLPMCDKSSQYWITYNGEVYNYLEIRKELIELGCHFKTESDTEVILQAYIVWGTECVEKFEGMFAFAIADLNKNEVFLARDVFGIKPLYYWISPNGDFCFASEIKQFTEFPGWKAQMNKQRVFEYLYYSLTDHTEETLFENVFQIKPANLLVLNLGETPTWVQGKPIQTKTYFQFKPDAPEENFESAKQKFKERFEESVDLHLRSDVPVGSALSGGLDSSAIVCEINKILKAQGKSELQKTFSAINDNPNFSEEKWIDKVTEHTNVDAYFVTPTSEDVFKLTHKILWHMDEPYQSQSAFLGYHVFELAAKNNVKVLLNGQGADEYLSGYGEIRILRWYLLFKNFAWLKLYKEFKFNLGIKPLDYFTIILRFFTYSFPKGWINFFNSKTEMFRQYSRIMPPNKFVNKFKHPYLNYLSKRKNLLDLITYQLICSPLPRYLRWEDRNSMANSVEARVPFLNKKLVSFTAGQPLDFLDGVDTSKKLLVESLKELLPEAIYNRKDKVGFISAEELWVKEDKDGKFEELFNASISILGDLVNPIEAKKYYLKLKRDEIPFDYLYWRLILLGIWIELFKIERS